MRLFGRAGEYDHIMPKTSVFERASESIGDAFSSFFNRVSRVVKSAVGSIAHGGKVVIHYAGAPFRAMNDAKNALFDKLHDVFGEKTGMCSSSY